MTTTDSPSSALVKDDGPIHAVIQAVYEAWAANDPDAFAALYLGDATVVQPGVHKKNREDIRTSMAAAFAGPLKGSRVSDTPQDVRYLGDAAAVVISEGGILMAGETELPSQRRVRATWVLAKRGWQMARCGLPQQPRRLTGPGDHRRRRDI